MEVQANMTEAVFFLSSRPLSLFRGWCCCCFVSLIGHYAVLRMYLVFFCVFAVFVLFTIYVELQLPRTDTLRSSNSIWFFCRRFFLSISFISKRGRNFRITNNKIGKWALANGRLHSIQPIDTHIYIFGGDISHRLPNFIGRCSAESATRYLYNETN